MLLLVIPRLHAERDAAPVNNQFNIAQDIITSDGWGLFNYDTPLLFKRDGTLDAGIILSFSYGINRFMGCTFGIPILFDNERYTKSRGLSDISFNLQWHVYRTENQIFVLKTGMQFPTGDTSSRPALGTGSFCPTISYAAIHSSERLYAGFICGTTIGTTRRNKNPGTSFNFQLGAGPKFPLYTKNDGQIYTFLEVQGYYGSPTKANGNLVPLTGSQLILLGPILSYDTNIDQYILQLFVPLSERQFGKLPATNIVVTLSYQRDF